MRLSCLAAVLPALLATPAAADSVRLTLFAKVVAGLAEGGQTLVGVLGKGTVKRLGDGVYEIGFAKGPARFVFEEPEPCVFTMLTEMEGETAYPARFDLNRIDTIEVRDMGEWEGLRATLVTLTGAEDAMQVFVNDIWQNQQAPAFLSSSVTSAQLTFAADALLKAC
jgi:hypothetical protein